MDISELSQALQRDAVQVVFINVLLQQIGLPVPAVPTLLVAGSLAASPGQLGKILAGAILASALADWLWYLAGRAFGYRILAGLCKLSINPGSCVSQTEARFIRWGPRSLVVAKFIPGFSTVAPPIAGALRMAMPGFLAAAATGAALWAGLALEFIGRQAGGIVATGLALAALWLGWKLWQKYRFRQLCSVPHILPDELLAAMATQDPPLVLDLRGHLMVSETGPIPGTTVAEHDRLFDAVGDRPTNRPIVTLCACPEDAGAVQAARRLLDAGYLSVRPLKGGYEAWLAASGKAGS